MSKRNNKPLKWRILKTESLDYIIPEASTLHHLGIKHFGLKAWTEALDKLRDDWADHSNRRT